MSKTKRKPIYQDYYTEFDYTDVMEKLPDLIREAEKQAGEFLEPTVHEKHEVMNIIRDFLRENKRKVYGGTALNETIKLVNPDDAIYDDYSFSDIEFYTPTPVVDLVNICNILYEKGYKYIVGKEAQHEETYSIFVNFQLYCDLTYVPYRVYNGINVIEIDGILYAHPHFMLIDYLRMINQPLTAAKQRWEKAFTRMYKLLKNYPLEYYNNSFDFTINDAVEPIINNIKENFLRIESVQKTCLISGFEAYNFYIRHAAGDRSVEQPSRAQHKSKNLNDLLTKIPYLEIVSVNYQENFKDLYTFVRSNVKHPEKISIEEYYPLFQHTNYCAVILYDNMPVVKVYDGDGLCIPSVHTTRGYLYVGFQQLLLKFLIDKFRAHLDKNRSMYFNYGIAISNLISARNIFLESRKLGVINNTVFSEFRISCVGSTVGYIREGQLRGLKNMKLGKQPFKYVPEMFFNYSAESQAKFDPAKHFFKNSSGNKILNEKNLLFKIDDNGNISLNDKTTDSTDTTDSTSDSETK